MKVAEWFKLTEYRFDVRRFDLQHELMIFSQFICIFQIGFMTLYSAMRNVLVYVPLHMGKIMNYDFLAASKRRYVTDWLEV